ncbi:MAG: hypothetical protein JNG84_07240 [Archangium sp.]|nr:hypothetical protein [Archangium sp.]
MTQRRAVLLGVVVVLVLAFVVWLVLRRDAATGDADRAESARADTGVPPRSVEPRDALRAAVQPRTVRQARAPIEVRSTL